MTTTLTIADKDRTFTVTFPETFDLSVGMFQVDGGYRYSVGTTDTDSTIARIRLHQLVNSLRQHLGTRQVIERAHFVNDTCHAYMYDAIITITEKFANVYLEIESADFSWSINGK